MSDSFNVQTVTLPVGQFSGAGPIALWRVPASGGGVTILEATAYQNGTGGSAITAGTAIGLKLVTFGTIGAPGTAGTVPTVNGTICNFAGTLYLGAGTVHAAPSIGTPYVGPGYLVGIAETAGTIAGGITIQLGYVLGK